MHPNFFVVSNAKYQRYTRISKGISVHRWIHKYWSGIKSKCCRRHTEVRHVSECPKPCHQEISMAHTQLFARTDADESFSSSDAAIRKATVHPQRIPKLASNQFNDQTTSESAFFPRTERRTKTRKLSEAFVRFYQHRYSESIYLWGDVVEKSKTPTTAISTTCFCEETRQSVFALSA